MLRLIVKPHHHDRDVIALRFADGELADRVHHVLHQLTGAEIASGGLHALGDAFVSELVPSGLTSMMKPRSVALRVIA